VDERQVVCCFNGGEISDSQRDEFSKVTLLERAEIYIYMHFNSISVRIELRFICCLYILFVYIACISCLFELVLRR
jgi:hypothetical protein